MQYISNLFKRNKALVPIPTGMKPTFAHCPGIKSVVFDIYGTLLISASGDIDEAGLSTIHLERALRHGGVKILPQADLSKVELLLEIISILKSTIKSEHCASKSQGIDFPEIDIRSIIRKTLNKCKKKNWIDYNSHFSPDRIIFTFEFFSNNVFPMPGMVSVLDALREKSLPLGIISNAQFYTPILVNYFYSDITEPVDFVHGFEEDLQIFSYKFLHGKPSTLLFQKILTTFTEKYQILPQEVLFIGNDALKDIYPAKKLGFKTALFAGDMRSYRPRENDPRIANMQADFLITDLRQILEILKL